MKPINIEALCREHGISCAADGNKHCRPGWVQLCCPFCHDDDFHMGYNVIGGYFNCYKCGSLDAHKVFMALLPGKRVNDLLERFGNRRPSMPRHGKAAERHNDIKVQWPKGCLNKPTPQHKRYLAGRRYDWKALAMQWGIRFTNFASDLPWRIVIPITENDELVAWQTRSISAGAAMKYIAIEDDKAVVPIKNTIYGYDAAKSYDWCVIVEGVFDVWRLGPPAVATFGTAVTTTQLGLLSRWSHRIIVMDTDMPGMKGAARLKGALAPFPGKTYQVILEGAHDADEYTDAQAKTFMKELEKACHAG